MGRPDGPLHLRPARHRPEPERPPHRKGGRLPAAGGHHRRLRAGDARPGLALPAQKGGEPPGDGPRRPPAHGGHAGQRPLAPRQADQGKRRPLRLPDPRERPHRHERQPVRRAGPVGRRQVRLGTAPRLLAGGRDGVVQLPAARRRVGLHRQAQAPGRRRQHLPDLRQHDHRRRRQPVHHPRRPARQRRRAVQRQREQRPNRRRPEVPRRRPAVHPGPQTPAQRQRDARRDRGTPGQPLLHPLRLRARRRRQRPKVHRRPRLVPGRRRLDPQEAERQRQLGRPQRHRLRPAVPVARPRAGDDEQAHLRPVRRPPRPAPPRAARPTRTPRTPSPTTGRASWRTGTSGRATWRTWPASSTTPPNGR